jgi:hypothetical protein
MMTGMTQAAVPHLHTTNAQASGTFVAFVKRDCPTCALALPVLQQIDEPTGQSGGALEVHVQDDIGFAAGLSHVRDDTVLAASYRCNIDTVPTLIRLRRKTFYSTQRPRRPRRSRRASPVRPPSPDPVVVFVAHPIQDRTHEKMRVLADGALEEILANLKG